MKTITPVYLHARASTGGFPTLNLGATYKKAIPFVIRSIQLSTSGSGTTGGFTINPSTVLLVIGTDAATLNLSTTNPTADLNQTFSPSIIASHLFGYYDNNEAVSLATEVELGNPIYVEANNPVSMYFSINTGILSQMAAILHTTDP